jgi:hypothetical protein
MCFPNFPEVNGNLLKLATERFEHGSVVGLESELSDLRSDRIAVSTKLIPLFDGKT